MIKINLELSENPVSRVYRIDCMEFMKQVPDKFFDLAVVDPPYGIKESGKKNHSRDKLTKATRYKAKDWDSKPPAQVYFDELLRVSKNQIVWGANHFISKIPHDSSCWLVWNKLNGNTDFADCELAWTSFSTSVRKFDFRWQGMLQGNMKYKEVRIHPTQKPIALYDWIFKNYAKDGMIILDTHLGSQSSRISAYKAKLHFWGTEIDVDYFSEGNERFEKIMSQILLL